MAHAAAVLPAARSLSRPGTPVVVVRQERLIRRLHELVRGRLITVVAPAGYGKTVLLRDFAIDYEARGAALAVSWYTVAPWDDDPTLIVGGLARAIRARWPGAAERTLRLLKEARTGASPAESERLVASAVGALATGLQEHEPEGLVLILDDYHVVNQNASVGHAVGLLLRQLPAHVCLVLLSRTIPAVDSGGFLPAHEVGTLSVEDLAFTPAELESLLRRHGLEPDEALVAAVHRQTEGWIAGVVLAMPGPDEGPAAERCAMLRSRLSAVANDHIHDYLANQLFQRQPQDDRELLLAAALPDVCDARDLDEVLQRADSAAALVRLQRAGVPLTREAAPDRYRMHGLLQQFLRAHLERYDRRRLRQLRYRWGAAAERRDDHAAAIAQYLAGRLYGRAAHVLERIGEQWIDVGRWQVIDGWLSQFPAPLVQERPRLGLCAARLALAQGQRPSLAVERARTARFAAQRSRDSEAEARALLVEAMALVASGQPAEGQQLCEEALQSRSVRRSKPLLAEAYRSLSIAESVRGLPAAALEHLEQALLLYEKDGRTWDVAVALNNLGVAYEQLGQAERARRYHTRALELRRDLGDLAGAATSMNNLGLLRFYDGALGQAEALFGEALRLAEQTANLRAQAAARVNLGDLWRARQRPDEALACYGAALTVAPTVSDPRWRAYALVGVAAGKLLSGDVTAAQQAARHAIEEAERNQLVEVGGHASVVLAAVALASGQRRTADAILERARQIARETGSQPLQVRAYLWSAHAAYQRKRWGEALSCARLACEAAAALGGPTLVVLEGPALVPVLRMAAERGVATELLARALDDLNGAVAAAVREATAPAPAPVLLPMVTLRLLGTFAGTMAGEPLELVVPPRSRLRELLAYLALHPAGRRREELTADLWPDAPPGNEGALLYTTLHRLRQAVFPELISSEGPPAGVYRIDPSVPLSVDVHQFEQLLDEAETTGLAPTRRLSCLSAAIDHYGGPFFPECYADWAAAARYRLERRYVTALAQLAEATWEAQDYRACLAWCERLLATEPEEESIHCRTLECYERLGEALAGVMHYRHYARRLDEDYRTRPAAQVTAIARRLEALCASIGMVAGHSPRTARQWAT